MAINDVRLYAVRELQDLPDLYDYNVGVSSSSSLPSVHSTTSNTDAHSLDLTHESNPSTDALVLKSSLHQQQQHEVLGAEESSTSSSSHDDDDDEEEELLGLSLLCLEPAQPPSPAVVRLDLDFLKQDPPKAHVLRQQCGYEYYY